MENERELLQLAAHRVMQNDPELATHLKTAHKSSKHKKKTTEIFESMRQRGGPQSGLEAMGAPDEGFALETIVLRVGRPSILVQDNKYSANDPLLNEPGSAVWKTRLFKKPVQKNLLFAIPKVGRVELQNNPDFEWVGTGWLLAKDIIVTNRHVAAEFGRANGARFEFLPGFPNGIMSARLDFREEYQRDGVSEFAVKDILYIAGADDPDMALLKIEQRNGSGAELDGNLRLAKSEPEAKQYVATIGYPAADSRVPDHDLVLKFFGDIYNKKRLAPGQILRASDGLIFHDCSTLGGNSGSPVIDLATGETLGLHFSGLYLQENRGVAAPLLADYLQKVQSKRLPKSAQRQPVTSDIPAKIDNAGSNLLSQVPTSTPSKISFKIELPLELNISFGGLPNVKSTVVVGSATSSEDLLSTVREVREKLGADPNVLRVRPGYVFANGWITDTLAVVVVLNDSEAPPQTPIPESWRGVPIEVRGPSPADLIEEMDLSLEGVRPTSYEKPKDFQLKPVNEQMTVLCHVSPDAGLPTLKSFLAKTKKSLTVGMYDFTAPDVVTSVINSVKDKPKKMTLVLQEKEALGGTIKDQEGDLHETIVLSRIKKALGNRLDYAPASVGKNKQFASAYHIKVAVRDSVSFWLSSGNWQSTNQYSHTPQPNSTDWFFLENLNREWHVVIDNKNLAQQFEEYLKYDLDNASQDEAPRPRTPLLEVEEVPEVIERPVGAKPTYFQPKSISGVISVHPLLTPDNYQEETLALISSAKKSILFQNQSLNLQGVDNHGNDKNDPRFAKLYNTLLAKQKAGLDVRIIMRGDFDPKAYLELLKKLGFDDKRIKVQNHCHTKGIIVDGRKVLLGSHNWTNEGTLANRDASLIFDSEEIAAYYAQIFEFDWKNLARFDTGPTRRTRKVSYGDTEVPPRPGWVRIAAGDLG